jgi:carbon storage regulator
VLVLSRKAQESIMIGNDITVTVLRIAGGQIRLGIEAPRTMPVMRSELRPPSPPGEPEPDSRTPLPTP